VVERDLANPFLRPEARSEGLQFPERGRCVTVRELDADGYAKKAEEGC
jgi:hypothetical protein